jgi:hypothetical protein
VQEVVKQLRYRYKSTLDGAPVRFQLHGNFEGQVAGPREIFEAWLYGLVFHQASDKQELLAELKKYGAGRAFPFAINLIVLQLVGTIVDLDDVLADFLSQPRVPRIGDSDGTTAPI